MPLRSCTSRDLTPILPVRGTQSSCDAWLTHEFLLEILSTLLRDSFPALRSITVCSRFVIMRPNEEIWELPLLHIIAVGRPIPERLKMIVLKSMHNKENKCCCEQLVGTSEKVVGSEERLPELLFGLVELTIRLDYCKDLGRCARFMWSILPGMRDVLRFEYRSSSLFGDWLPYTLPDMI